MGEGPADRILIASTDTDLRVSIASAIGDADTVETTDPVTTAALAVAVRPRVMFVDARDPELATSIVAALREDFRVALVPLIFVVDEEPDARVRDLVAGADDYVRVEAGATEIAARLQVTLRRSDAMRGVNPLTGLPGNVVIREELTRRLSVGESFACLYADLDDFKSYNDRYGFDRGDSVIRLMAEIVFAALEEVVGGACFAGHVGGDDFVAITAPQDAEPVAERIVASFDARIGDLYEPADRERGYIEVTDRRGVSVQAPICSVSIGIVTSRRRLGTAAEMAQVAAEVKAVAKRRPGSAWAADRRRS